ncbi:MAG: DegV family protein [Candidatus Heimdallarchaeaceae archaeon]
MTVKIFSDTSADLNLPNDKTLYEKYGIVTFPMHIIFGTDDYKELVDLKTSEFYRLLETRTEHPSTSQPTQYDILANYEKYGKEYDELVSFHISSKLSGSYANALMAKKMYEKATSNPAKVYLIDSLNASSVVGLMAIKATKLVEEGLSGKEIEEEIMKWRDNDITIFFTVKDMDWLYKGGRLSKAKYYIGSMLNMKPILTLKEGSIIVAKSVSGFDKTVDQLIKMAFDKFGNEDGSEFTVSLIEAAYRDKAQEIQDLVLERYPKCKRGMIFEMGGTIASHTGPGTIGLILSRNLEF